jgi:heme/copper-type cytochrome/quinol oxidase subunit 4
MTSETALKAYVAQIAGPLIRVIGDRFPSEVKAAILATMGFVRLLVILFCFVLID